MPPQYVDFGSHLSASITSDHDVVHHDYIPGAWLDFPNPEESSEPNTTRSKARAIAKEALANLRRAAAEAEDERLRRQTLKMRHAAEGKKMASAAAKGDKESTVHPTSICAILAQDTLDTTNAPISAPRRATIDPSLVSTGMPSSSGTAVPGQGNASKTPHSASRRPRNGPSLNSAGQNASQAPTHARGLLSLMDDFNARGGAHTAATRRLVDGGFISEGQFAAAAVRGAEPRADARAVDREVTQEDRLAAVRARLAAKGRFVATVSQQVSSSGSHAVKGVPPMPVRPGPAQACVTLGPSKLPTRKMETCVSPGAAQPGFSTTDGVKQPVRNNVVVDLSPTGRSKPKIEAGPRSTGQSISRNLPIYDPGHAPKSPSTNLAPAAAASTTTTTTSSQSVSEKAQANAHRYASAAKSSSEPAQEAAAQKLTQGAEHMECDVEKETSTKLTATTGTTGTTPSQAVNEKAQAILNHYGEAMSALDDAFAAAFVAHKLNQDTDRVNPGFGNEPCNPAQLKTPTTPSAQSTKGLGIKPDVAKTAEVDDGFDVVNSKGPSAANGSPLPDPDLIMDQLDVQFPPTMKGFQGWEDDYDSDDSEEWDLGGLAEWKWVGEKSAQKSSTTGGQA